METRSPYRFLTLFIGLLLLVNTYGMRVYGQDRLDRIIELPAMEGTIYQLLEKVTEASGLLFIYDSRVMDNNKWVSFAGGSFPVREAILRIAGNPGLSIELVGTHILIQLSGTAPGAMDKPAWQEMEATDHITLDGTVTDRHTDEPVAYATIGMMGSSLGTVSNQNGDFRIRIPDSLRHTPLQISHVGYEPLLLELNQLPPGENIYRLEPKNISLQEVIVRLVKPDKVIRDMLDHRSLNYASHPVYLTSFYREGVEKKRSFVHLTEAVFKVYKAPWQTLSVDQVKMLKMRKLTNPLEKDTLITKIKSGINGVIMLDVVKNLPDFLDPEESHNFYDYAYTDLVVMDNRMANVISFEQKKGIRYPLFTGELYIDTENDALLMSRFEVHPDHVEEATSNYIERKSRGLNIKAKKISYQISYKEWNGTYYLHHIRGDLHFNVRKKRHLFSKSIHLFFEMVTCDITDSDVSRFTRSETIPKTSVFSDMDFTYDPGFWSDFNIILPEEKIQEAVNNISLKIEEITE